MNKFKKYYFSLLVFSFSFMLTFNMKHNTSYITGKQDYWEKPPILINCYRSFNSEAVIQRSILFWELHGFKISFYENKIDKDICEKDSIEGFILIKPAKQKDLKPGVLAFTKRKTSFGKITASTIFISRGTFSYPLLLEHEIGHAMGLKHEDEIGNIMHPTYELMGKDY